VFGLFSTAILLTLFTGPADGVERPSVAQSDRDGYVRVEARGARDLAPGAKFTIDLEATIEQGWHMYSLHLEENLGIATRIEFESDAFERAGEVTESPPKAHYSELMGGTMLEHYEKATFTVPFEAPAGVSSGSHRVPVSFTYQICDANSCLPPVTLAFELPVIVGAVSPPSATTGSSSSTGDEEKTPGVGAKGGDEKRPIMGATGHLVVRARGQEDGLVEITARGVENLEPGQSFSIVIDTKIEKGWHIYSLHSDRDTEGDPTTVVAPDPTPFRAAGPPTESKPHEHFSEVMGVVMHEHIDKATFELPLAVPEKTPTGVHRVRIEFTYMVCDVNGCLPDETLTLEVPVAVGVSLPRSGTGGSAGTSSGSTSSGSSGSASTSGSPPFIFEAVRPQLGSFAPGDAITIDYRGEVLAPDIEIPAIEPSIVDRAATGGLWGIIVFGIFGALFALVTPCVYPMIPITVSVFTKHSEDGEKNVFFLAVVFCLGIVVTFTGIGFIASIALGATAGNFFATNPSINFILGALFIWFAFSLFGYYDISLPSGLTTRASNATSGGGVLSVILMGFVFSITTFTCVGPIVATLLALAVTSGGQWLALAGMVAFSATFAVPFFFLALFPKILKGMPRSGGWLNAVKVVLGFVELAAAFKFLAVVPLNGFGINALFREMVFLIWAVLFVLCALYLFGWVRFKNDSKLERRSLPRLGFVVGALALAAYFGYGATGRLIEPNLEAQIVVPSFFAKKQEVARVAQRDAASSDQTTRLEPAGSPEEPEPTLRERVIAAIDRSPFWSGVFETDPVHLPWRVFSWETRADLDAALAEVRGSGKPVFLNFTGHT
ncbi:MAG: hypothetical protein KDC38_16625, partial [Planctomycetes bacterium]|nr:hypothetical protein [Planctomycetota bacterium]